MVCRVITWLFQIVTLHLPGGMIFDKHDKSRRYLTSMTAYKAIFSPNEKLRPLQHYSFALTSQENSIDSLKITGPVA